MKRQQKKVAATVTRDGSAAVYAEGAVVG